MKAIAKQSILTCDLQVSFGSLRSSNTIGDLTHVGPSIISLHRVDDQVAGAALGADPALHAGDGEDGGVVPVPGDREVARGALTLAHEADNVSLCLVLIQRRIGDHSSTWNKENIFSSAMI